MLTECLYESLILLYDDRCSAPVIGHAVAMMIWKLPWDLLEQAPIGVTKAIDTLLEISNNQVVGLITFALVEKWCKILPLQGTGILKLVNHVVTKILSESLIDKWCILPINDLIDQ